ncbi:hypothetical protein EVAR_91727_1 [Eumeta japonica]|uniref:Uncharacterized protein n=1 Tax=Eumeta variegata TaxID=151549 RepID=A0A4C1TG79_EUMVA|nr:hypothetical protein EVAR_91727_1 [Eumeta japonica]
MNTRSYSSRGPLTCAQNRSGARAPRMARRGATPVQTLTSRLSSPLARECKLHIKFVSIDEYEYIDSSSHENSRGGAASHVFERRFGYRQKFCYGGETAANGMEDLDRDVGSSATSANQSRKVGPAMDQFETYRNKIQISQPGKNRVERNFQEEFEAFLGLLLCTSTFISNNEDLTILFATDGMNKLFYKPEVGGGACGWGPAGKRHLDYNGQSDTGSLKDLQQYNDKNQGVNA